MEFYVTSNTEFSQACETNNLNKAIRLYNLGVDIADINAEFMSCCWGDRFELAKWLYSVGADIHIQQDSSFVNACHSGNLEIAKWLYSLGADIHAQNDLAFLCSCNNNDIELAKWLHSIGADINALNCQAFRFNCEAGNLEIAQWLYDIGIMKCDIPLENVNVETAKWLFTINPKLIIKSLKNIPKNTFDNLDISKETKILLECIINNAEFPPIEQVDDIVIYSVAYYNMINHMTKLKNQFSYIHFDIVNDKIENLVL